VPRKGYQLELGEPRFDMFEAEFTHEGDRCTLRAGLEEPALRILGEIVHDIDLRDAKFGRDETAGIAGLIGDIVLAHSDDEQRLARSAAILDDVYRHFRTKKRG
jgi:hypothetical protein